ncbi:MAG TPA: tRNA (adenosine(37)-N6)-threonylcarbamoyltransferase complex ATPase subunit type 1 TsaE [Clostridiales bacterium]|nr:tRNA (adenosine(37)-N6)-threonylcarbamoyltransferase complex ATPase subunit type 1 TsaE [Clostridiales bacterium]
MGNEDRYDVCETASEKATERAGFDFAGKVKSGDIILFYGSVGSGKTVFARGLCRGLGFEGYVNSPSYIIMNQYEAGELTVYHYDLYRISSTLELTEIGFYDFPGKENTVTLIEWAEMLDGEIPEKRIEVRIGVKGEKKRTIKIERIG